MCANISYFLFMAAFIFCPCRGGIHQTILIDEQRIQSDILVKRFVDLLRRIDFEIPYDYIVFVKDVAKRNSCIFEESIAHVNKPIIIFSNMTDNYSLQQQHSSNFLLLTCSLEYLEQFSIVRTVYQYVPHILWLEAPTVAAVEEELNNLCSAILRSGYFQNLIITPQSLNEESNYFHCDFQQQLKLISHKLFVNPFLNLQGLSITTESDQLPPRSILVYDDLGQLKLTGFVANYLTTFAERYNASLVIVPPAVIGVPVYSDVLSNKTFQGMLDIAAVAARFQVDSSSESYSYPVELMEYCYMIPLPHIRPVYDVFFYIIEVGALLIILIYFVIFAILLNIGEHNNAKHLNASSIFLNDKSIRGLLGQSFVMPRRTSLFMKYILLLVCYSSIMVSTSYQAYLQSHLIHPSLEKRIETYDDIRKSNLKILVDGRESVHIYRTMQERYDDLFVKKNLSRFFKLRDSMDLRYIYPVSQTRWSVFQERQKLFRRKLFYYSRHLCVTNLVLLSFPLRPGLPYKSQFNQHLLDIRDSGLLDCWMKHNFLNMVRFKILSFTDISVADEYAASLVLYDFLWIWILYAAFNLLATLMFVGELLWNKI